MARYWQRHQENLKIWIRCARLVGSEECNRPQPAKSCHSQKAAFDALKLLAVSIHVQIANSQPQRARKTAS